MATEKGGGWKGRILPGGGRAPLVITLVVVLALGAAYYAYYRNQVAYYTGRNMRLLSTLTAQVEDQISTNAGYIRIAGEDPENQPPIRIDLCPLDAGAAQATRTAMVKPEVKRSLEQTGEGWLLRLVYAAPAAEVSDKPQVSWCAGLPLEEVVGPVFTRKAAAAFDLMLLASDDGRVLYQVRPPPSSSALLRRNDEEIDEDAPTVSRRTDPALNLTNVSALSLDSGWRKSEPFKKEDLAKLSLGAHHTNVRLDDDGYVMFSQPYTLARAGAGGKPQQWIVCGLVSASRFRYQVSAVSISVILFGVALALLALCCWPYLRIALIDPSQALTIADVVLIVFCTIIGASVLTLLMLDVFAYRRISRTADVQLEQFSDKVNIGFAADLSRATDMLARAEALTAPHLNDLIAGYPSITLSQLRDDPAIAAWPYLKAIAWVDGNGVQRAKLTVPSARDPKVSVAGRRYFLDALGRRTWRVKDLRQRDRFCEYIVEWVRSMSTGEVAAVVAKHTEASPQYPVISARTELIDVSHAVRPPGVELAILDEDGEVIYHSDEQRIGYENFFAESDQNRELRAAVVARRAGMVSAMYWGEDQRMFVRPLEGSPWTLVTFRAKRLTRVLNVEAVLLTLLMLLLIATPFLFVYLCVLGIAPRYRAPSLWPDSDRRADYLRLAGILVTLLALFALHIDLLTPWAGFFTVLIVPPLSIAATDLVLHRENHPTRLKWSLGICMAALTVMLLLDVTVGEIDSGHWFSGYPLLSMGALGVAVLLSAAVILICVRESLPWAPARKLAARLEAGRVALVAGLRSLPRMDGAAKAAARWARLPLDYSVLYRTCGVLLLIIGASMPVIGLFTISNRVETELLVKYGQLRAAADLEHRIDHIQSFLSGGEGGEAAAETAQVATEPSKAVIADILRYDLRDVFDSDWWLLPATPFMPGHLPGPTDGAKCIEQMGTDWTIPDSAARRIPTLYDDSIAIRQLYSYGSADRLWWWCPVDRNLTLVRRIRFPADTAKALWKGVPADQRIVIRSTVLQAPLFPRAKETGAQTGQWNLDPGIYFFSFLLLGIGLLVLFWAATNFIAVRVLLIDVAEPLWLAQLPLSPTLGDHIFLVRRDQNVDALTGPNARRLATAFSDITFADLDRENGWWAALQRLDVSRAGQNVRVRDFEYGINDGVINEKKLQWLERLLALPDRTLMVISSVSASYILITPPPPPPPQVLTSPPSLPLSSPPSSPPADAPPPPTPAQRYFDRWRALMDRFVWITAEELELRRAAVAEAGSPPGDVVSAPPVDPEHSPLTWLEKETGRNRFLTQLREELDPQALTDRRRLIDELGERAETYYAGLWASCHDDEKLLLYQLAHNGLANGKNRRLLRRLIARGLVRRAPSLELFSETFRLYVLTAARKEDLVKRSKEERPSSTWDALRIPLFVVITAFLLLLFTTQKDLLTTTTALTAALTTGLPLIVKLMGVFTERRLEGGGTH